ncbi:hypothetical protein [Streptomyces sp. NPDC090445]|uniref:hypothetical protein n=1 Tax=Streptomyces sp. NPDC090445 TaxID=3365963 RepID=UPI003823A166
MTAATASSAPLTERAALDALLSSGASPQALVQELLGERQLWWKCVSEAVRADPSWLFDRRTEELRAWIEATAPDGGAADTLTPAGHAWLVGRALAAAQDPAGAHVEALTPSARAWQRSRLLSSRAAPGPAEPSGRQLDGLSAGVARGLRDVVGQLREWQAHGAAEDGDRRDHPGARDAGARDEGSADREHDDHHHHHATSTAVCGVVVVAALLMAGARPGRRTVSVPVVFGRSAGPAGLQPGEDGATGVLELSELPSGPAGLYPDPRAMAGVVSPNGQFAVSLGHAWNAAGPRRTGRCVLWRLVLSDEPAPLARIEGPSLGAAFALGLRELLRRPPTRRPSAARLRDVFYGLRPRTAVTGALDGGERLLRVTDMDAKLLAARRKGLRLVAPEPNRLDIAHAPEPGEVRFAADLRQADRHARRFRTGRLAVALALVVTATTTGVLVTRQDAAALQRLTTAHRLAEVSQSLIESDVGLAELFAVQAYRHHADSLTRTALFQAVTAAPLLAGSAQASGPVSAVSSSGDESTVLAGTRQGVVQQWTVAGTGTGTGSGTGGGKGPGTRAGAAFGPARTLGRLPGPVTAVAADAGGTTVAATDGTSVAVWAAGRPAEAPRTPEGQKPKAVAVSPSGRFVAAATTDGVFDSKATLSLLDRTTGNTGRLTLATMALTPSALAFSDDASLVALESGYGSWERISVPSLARTAGSTVGFGVHNQASALAPDGSHFSYTNGAETLPVWPSDGEPDIDDPARLAQTRAGHPATALALSSGGTWAAEAVGTDIHVSQITVRGQRPSAPETLSGAGLVSPGMLAFLGHGNRLLSVSGDVLSLWDPGRRTRISTQIEATVPVSCNGCRAPVVVLSPDGRSAAVLDGNTAGIEVVGLDPPGAGRRYFTSDDLLMGDWGFAAAAWQRDGSGLVVEAADGSAKIVSPAQDYRVTGTWPAVMTQREGSHPPVLLQFLPDGRRVAEVDDAGAIRFRDAATGEVLRQVAGRTDRSGGKDLPWQLRPGQVAVDREAAHVAWIDRFGPSSSREYEVVVTDTASGRSRQLPTPDAVGLAFVGDRLLVQHKSGRLDVWTASGDRHLDTVEGIPDLAVGPVADGNVVAGKSAADTIRLIDVQSGHALGTIPLPPGPKGVSTGLALTADGTALVTATESGWIGNPGTKGTLIVWRLDPGTWVRSACASVGRELAPAVWQKYMTSKAPSDLRCPS